MRVKVKGYLFTHWTCPVCDEANEDEGNCSDDKVICEFCGESFDVSDGAM